MVKIKRIRNILPAVLSLLLIILFTSPLFSHLLYAQKDNEEYRVLIDASSNNFPPVNILDKDGNLKGFGRDLANEAMKAVGIEVRHIHSPDWVQVLEWLDSGKADFIHDTGYTKEREIFLDYSDPILEMPEMIFVQPERYDILGLNSLKGKTVACVNKHITHQYLQTFPGIKCYIVKSPVEGLYALIAGNADAFVYPKQIVLYLAQSLRLTDKIKTTGDPLRTLTWSMVVKKGNKEILALLNRGIAKVRENGKYERIYQKWWGKRILSGYSKQEVRVMIAIAVGGTLLTTFALLLLLFNRKFREEKRDLEVQVAERKQATEALQESEEKYRTLFESSRDAIMTLAPPEWMFTSCNKAAEELFRVRDEAEFISHSPWQFSPEFQPGGEPSDNKSIEMIETAMRNGSHFFEWTHCYTNGTTFPAEVLLTRIESKDQVLIQATVRDITDRKQAEEEKKKLESRVQQAQKMESIGTLAGGIAHDFNNILSPILIHSEIAMSDLSNDNPLQFNLKEILCAGERAKDLVRQILTFSRMKEGKRVSIRITPIIKEALKMLRASIPTTIEIVRKLDAEKDIINGDLTQIHQVLMNLCTNAAYAMKEKGGRMEIYLTEQELDDKAVLEYSDLKPGLYLKLTVKDNGPGMDNETIKNIFEPYFTTKGPGEGTGLGLAVVHGIVKSYGGDIRVESNLGKGTTFDLLFPRVDEKILPKPAIAAEMPKGTESIMLVDDEISYVNAMKPLLEKLGYKITAFFDSIEAIETFRKTPTLFDLIITDMTMPSMTGKDLANEAKTIRPGIPIILCTGFSDQVDEETSKANGIDAFAIKPIDIPEMAKVIRGVLEK